MLHTAQRFFVKFREQIMYMAVGGATTVVNYIIFSILLYLLGLHYILSNTAAWVGAVVFSYFASGRWVYRSSAKRSVREAGKFAASRLFSLGIETLLLWCMVDMLAVSEFISKLVVAVIVVILNYLTGLWVFKRKIKK